MHNSILSEFFPEAGLGKFLLTKWHNSSDVFLGSQVKKIHEYTTLVLRSSPVLDLVYKSLAFKESPIYSYMKHFIQHFNISIKLKNLDKS